MEDVKNAPNLIQEIVNWWIVLYQKGFHGVMADPRKQKYTQPIENWLTPNKLRKLLNKHNFATKLHIGFMTSRNYGYTLSQRLFGNRVVINTANKFGVSRYYWKFMLPISMYQMVIAQQTKQT